MKNIKINCFKTNKVQQKRGHSFVPTVIYYGSAWKNIGKT